MVIQSILLYGAETWVISEAKLRKLRTFHRSCARLLTKRFIRQNEDETWHYPDSASVLIEAGLYEIEHNIQNRRDTLSEFCEKQGYISEL